MSVLQLPSSPCGLASSVTWKKLTSAVYLMSSKRLGHFQQNHFLKQEDFFVQAKSEGHEECLCGGASRLVTSLDRVATLLRATPRPVTRAIPGPESSFREGLVFDPLALCAAFEKPKDISVKIKAAVLWCQKWVLPLCTKGNQNCKK